jgi:hypothetical protein
VRNEKSQVLWTDSSRSRRLRLTQSTAAAAHFAKPEMPRKQSQPAAKGNAEKAGGKNVSAFVFMHELEYANSNGIICKGASLLEF